MRFIEEVKSDKRMSFDGFVEKVSVCGSRVITPLTDRGDNRISSLIILDLKDQRPL